MQTLSAPPPDDLAAVGRLPDDALVGVGTVAALLGVSQRHVWRMADAGAIVRPISLGAAKRWHLGALRAWLRAASQPVRAR